MTSHEERERERVRAVLAGEKADAIIRLARARTLLDVVDDLVEPEGLRPLLGYVFGAALERIRSHRTLLGLEVVYALDMADVIIVEQARRDQ